MSGPSHFTIDQALEIGRALGVDWQQVSLDQFRLGLEVELEHGRRDPRTDVTGDDPIVTGKIALAHLHEIPDYYSRLDQLEATAQDFWAERRQSVPNRGFAGEDCC